MQTRLRILDAARKLLSEKDYKRMSIEAIAREARMAKGTVYRHFANKGEIVLAIAQHEHDELLKRLEEIARGSQPPVARLVAVERERVLARFDQRGKGRPALESVAALGEALAEQGERARQAQVALVEQLIREGVERGDLDVDDPGRAAVLFHLAFDALVTASPAGVASDRDALEAAVNDLADLLLVGMEPPKMIVD